MYHKINKLNLNCSVGKADYLDDAFRNWLRSSDALFRLLKYADKRRITRRVVIYLPGSTVCKLNLFSQNRKRCVGFLKGSFYSEWYIKRVTNRRRVTARWIVWIVIFTPRVNSYFHFLLVYITVNILLWDTPFLYRLYELPI